MIKKLYIAMLCITSIAFSQEKKEAVNTTVNAELSFGRLGLDCSGRGTCDFNTNTSKTQVNTQITYNKDNTITLIIDRTKITKEEEYKIVGQYLATTTKINELTFVMEDDLALETETKTNLRTASHLTKIASGNYPIQITKEFFVVTLKLE